jgi:hypothetical protein
MRETYDGHVSFGAMLAAFLDGDPAVIAGWMSSGRPEPGDLERA